MTNRFSDSNQPHIVTRCHVCREVIDARGRCGCVELAKLPAAAEPAPRPPMSAAEHHAFPKGRWA